MCMCVYVCMCVCVYVRHAQKIAKLFFSVRSTQLPFKLNILFKKKYINLLGPKYSVIFIRGNFLEEKFLGQVGVYVI